MLGGDLQRRQVFITGSIVLFIVLAGVVVFGLYRAGFLKIGADVSGAEKIVKFDQLGALSNSSFTDVQAKNGGIELREEQ